MYKLSKRLGLTLSVLLSICSLSGCSSQDKTAVQETAQTFMAIVASDSEEDINKYATSEVANGDFVQLFDADTLVSQFSEGIEEYELTEESKNELDTFASLFSDMIKSYSVSDIRLDKKDDTHTASAVVTFKTSFAMDIIGSASVSNKISDAIEVYNADHADEIAALYEEGNDVAEAKIYNDMLEIILEIYEDEIQNSHEMTYAIVLDLEKNNETDSWIVTGVNDYDSSSAKSSK